MYCSNCGKEIDDKSNFCIFCGSKVDKNHRSNEHDLKKEKNKIKDDVCQLEKTTEEIIKGEKRYYLEGLRRSGNKFLTGVTLPSQIVIKDDVVYVETELKRNHTRKERFKKGDIDHIQFKTLPVVYTSDIVRLLLFGLLMFVTGGMSFFAVLLSVKIMLSRHLILELKSGERVKIPLKQDGDAIQFLKDLSYPENDLKKIEEKKIDDTNWMIRDKIICIVLFIIAVATIGFGIDEYTNEDSLTENVQNSQFEDADIEDVESIDQYQTITTEDIARNPEVYYNKKIRLENVTFTEVLDSYSILYQGGWCDIEYDGIVVDESGNSIGKLLNGDNGIIEGTFKEEDLMHTSAPYLIADRVIVLSQSGDYNIFETSENEVSSYENSETDLQAVNSDGCIGCLISGKYKKISSQGDICMYEIDQEGDSYYLTMTIEIPLTDYSSTIDELYSVFDDLANGYGIGSDTNKYILMDKLQLDVGNIESSGTAYLYLKNTDEIAVYVSNLIDGGLSVRLSNEMNSLLGSYEAEIIEGYFGKYDQ